MRLSSAPVNMAEDALVDADVAVELGLHHVERIESAVHLALVQVEHQVHVAVQAPLAQAVSAAEIAARRQSEHRRSGQVLAQAVVRVQTFGQRTQVGRLQLPLLHLQLAGVLENAELTSAQQSPHSTEIGLILVEEQAHLIASFE